MNRFKIDCEKDILYWWIEGSGYYQIPEENKKKGKRYYELFFKLDTDPLHWLNFVITYSKGKLWVECWYKKRIGDNDYKHFRKKIEKENNIVELELKDEDEMIKVWSEKKQKQVWVNKLDYQKNNS